MQPARPIAREHLAHLMWCDHDAAGARHSLRQSLVSLRAALGSIGPEAIVADAATVRLIESDRIDIDAGRFDRLARSAAPTELRAAAELYRGEFLVGLSIN